MICLRCNQYSDAAMEANGFYEASTKAFSIESFSFGWKHRTMCRVCGFRVPPHLDTSGPALRRANGSWVCTWALLFQPECIQASSDTSRHRLTHGRRHLQRQRLRRLSPAINTIVDFTKRDGGRTPRMHSPPTIPVRSNTSIDDVRRCKINASGN